MAAVRRTLDTNICSYVLRRRTAPMAGRFAQNVLEFLRVSGLAVEEWDMKR